MPSEKSEAQSVVSETEAEIIAKINDLKIERERLDALLNKYDALLPKFEDFSSAGIIREMRKKGLSFEKVERNLERLYDELRKINPNSPIFKSEKPQ